MIITTLRWIAIGFWFCSSSLYALPVEKTTNLSAFVIEYALKQIVPAADERVEVKTSQRDNHKRLPFCALAIDAALSRKTMPEQSNAVVLSCKGATSWTIYVPITVQIFTDVLAARRMIMPGETIALTDIAYESHDKNRLYDGFYKDEAAVIDLIATRIIAPGQALTRKNLKQVAMIKKNQTITLALKRGTIEINMVGIAKSDGYLNEMVKVLNPSSKKIVEARVTGLNQAEITY